MTLGDIDTEFRRQTGETDVNGRWSQSDVAGLANEARNNIALLLRWPDATWTQTLTGGTGTGITEITLPETVQIDRVYVNGQPIAPTSIPALEGTDIQFYDETSTDGTFKPQWNTQPYAGYPVQNAQTGYPAGMSPWYVGHRPNYYLRGGNMGIVPSPSGSFTIQIDGVGVPAPFVNQSDVDIFPSFFKYAIVHKMIELANLVDRNMETAQAHAALYKEQERELISWRRTLEKNKPRGPRFMSYRHFWSRGSLIGR